MRLIKRKDARRRTDKLPEESAATLSLGVRARACASSERSKQKNHFISTFLSRCHKTGKCINKPKGVEGGGIIKRRARSHRWRAVSSSPDSGGGVLCLCSVRVSCRCVWLIGAEVRQRGCGHLLIIGWKLL